MFLEIELVHQGYNLAFKQGLASSAVPIHVGLIQYGYVQWCLRLACLVTKHQIVKAIGSLDTSSSDKVGI